MLSSETKYKIFYELIKNRDFLGIYDDYDGILTFLLKIWPLKEMPSEDTRFSNAFDDARQHLVNNDDWDLEHTFNQRFGLLSDDEENFIKFLESIVSPDVRNTLESIDKYVTLINELLKGTRSHLYIVDYFEKLPIYKYGSEALQSKLQQEIQTSDIVFYKTRPKAPATYPYFLLTYDNWNDYNYITSMNLYFYRSAIESFEIGWVKIMRRDERKTWDVLPIEFTELSSDDCSLGQSEEYYENLKTLIPDHYQGILLALRDVGMFPSIAEEFEHDGVFISSLIRENEIEKLMRTIRFTLNDIDYTQAFKFNYRYLPPYADDELLFNFDFQYGDIIDHRIYGLIGKNGTGKTKLLSSLVHSLGNESDTDITPRKPLYGKIFTVSYSFFDRFNIPEPNTDFNYVYCGLKKPDGGWLTEPELITRFLESSKKISYKSEVENWRLILLNFIPHDLVSHLFVTKRGSLKFSAENFDQVHNMLSSGQNILLFILTEIIAQIRYNSLILYDEPETHLHPNAISLLMNTLFDLVNRFESFCILATHSPLVIQELQARNIYVIEREEGYASVRKLSKESFGENLTVISEDIFGNREIPKHYQALLEKLANEFNDLDFIVKLLETEERPLSLNARLYIKSLLTEKK